MVRSRVSTQQPKWYDDFVPGEIIETAPSEDSTTWSPTWLASLPRVHCIWPEGWSNMSPVGAVFESFPPKTGTNLLRPRRPPIVEMVICVLWSVRRLKNAMKNLPIYRCWSASRIMMELRCLVGFHSKFRVQTSTIVLAFDSAQWKISLRIHELSRFQRLTLWWGWGCSSLLLDK